MIWPQLTEQEGRFRIGLAKIDKEAARDLKMINARYTGVDKSRRPFAVTADSASQPAADSPMVALDQPKADIVLSNGSWVAVTAESGAYNRTSQILELKGSVNLFHDKGYEFRTSTAVIDLAAGDAIGTEPIQGQGSFGTIEAQGFILYNRGERVEFTGKTTVVLIRKPETGPASTGAK
jgi:lipopolysaccharide export system protein LptC